MNSHLPDVVQQKDSPPFDNTISKLSSRQYLAISLETTSSSLVLVAEEETGDS